MYLVNQAGTQLGQLLEVEAVQDDTNYVDGEYYAEWQIHSNGEIFAAYETEDALNAEMDRLIVAIRSGQRIYQFGEDNPNET